MRWRYLRESELDHELIWLCVSIFALVGGFAWFHFGLPIPKCPLHQLTGWPCPGCGTTRCASHLLRHQWAAAFLINPLAALGAVALLSFDLYAAFVLAARSRRLRIDSITTRTANFLRLGVFTLIGLNWAWLVKTGV